jgi:transaldolase
MKRLTPAKLFVDGGDPAETSEATRLLQAAGYMGLDGQTTNPSLVAKSPAIAARMATGNKLTSEELLSEYEKIIKGIEKSAPGDISIEVYADADTPAKDMIKQGLEFASWTPSAVIKLPITKQGLIAAAELKSQVRLNMTLCFSQSQAAAVYAATQGSAHPVYISPFIGRLDDIGLNGMQLVENILKMYAKGDGHVQVLTASVRSVDHILGALVLGTQALTLPFEKAFKPWAEKGFPLPEADYVFPSTGKGIAFEELDLQADWQSFNIQHDLTDAGLKKFAEDWNSLLI